MEIFGFDLDYLHSLFLSLQLFALLDELISLALQLLKNLLIISNLAEKFPIYSLFVEILFD